MRGIEGLSVERSLLVASIIAGITSLAITSWGLYSGLSNITGIGLSGVILAFTLGVIGYTYRVPNLNAYEVYSRALTSFITRLIEDSRLLEDYTISACPSNNSIIILLSPPRIDPCTIKRLGLWAYEDKPYIALMIKPSSLEFEYRDRGVDGLIEILNNIYGLNSIIYRGEEIYRVEFRNIRGYLSEIVGEPLNNLNVLAATAAAIAFNSRVYIEKWSIKHRTYEVELRIEARS